MDSRKISCMRTTQNIIFSFQIAHRSFRYLTTSLRYLTALHLEQRPPNQVHFLSPSSPARSWLRLFQSSPLQWMKAPSFMQVRNIGLILDTSLSLCISKFCRSGISGHYPICLNITITTLVHLPLSCIWNPLFTFCFFFCFTLSFHSIERDIFRRQSGYQFSLYLPPTHKSKDMKIQILNLTPKALSDRVLPLFPDSSCTIFLTKPH